LDNPKYGWDFYHISSHENITFNHILDNPRFSWNWYQVSKNPNITFKHYNKHPKLPWDIEGLCRNPMREGKKAFIRDFVKAEIQKNRELIMMRKIMEQKKHINSDVFNIIREYLV
jgi:hypothetical protein